MRPLTLYAYVFTAAAAISQSAFYYPRMPYVMAVHFGTFGVPDGFSSRSSFFGITFSMIALNIVVFAIAPRLIERKRDRRLKIPNRNYWLSAENIDEFYSFFRGRMAWFGIANLIFLGLVSQLVFLANLAPEPRLDGNAFAALLAAYFLFVIIWLFTFFGKIAKAGKKKV